MKKSGAAVFALCFKTRRFQQRPGMTSKVWQRRHECPVMIYPIRAFTTSPAMISPAADGTKEMLAGVALE